ncbi:MAG: hypothetical protein PHC68_00445 [Syntrophorhabdaceae bacterium]|nr:hypothetical protein [Syntrophorhabdaceae bacterium]
MSQNHVDLHELERKAKKAHREKGKIWTIEDVNFVEALTNLTDDEFWDFINEEEDHESR